LPGLLHHHFLFDADCYVKYSHVVTNAIGPAAMDINAYLLEEVVKSTTPPDETAAQTQSRRAVIGAMFHGYDPAGTMEAMIVCHCIELQFLLKAAIRDAGNLGLDVDRLARARAGAMALSKTWNLWVTKLEKIQHGKAVRAAEALKTAQADAASDVPPAADRKPAAPPSLNSARSDALPEKPREPAIYAGAAPAASVAVPVRSPGLPPPGVSPAPAARPAAGRQDAIPAQR